MKQKTRSIGLRLSEAQLNEVNQLAEKIGVESSFLIRTAIDGLLNYVEANDGKITLPIDFTTAFTDIKDLLEQLELKDKK